MACDLYRNLGKFSLVKYFRGASQPRKLNAQKFLYNEKLQRRKSTKHVTRGWHTFTRVAAV